MIVFAGCGGGGGVGPLPPLSEGIVLYEHPGFEGESIQVLSDQRDLESIAGPCPEHWDDCASSVRVAPGWRAIIYEDPEYTGKAFTVTSDINDLEHSPDPTNWDDKISSIRLLRP
jgi:Beta/Gamma crystallin